MTRVALNQEHPGLATLLVADGHEIGIKFGSTSGHHGNRGPGFGEREEGRTNRAFSKARRARSVLSVLENPHGE